MTVFIKTLSAPLLVAATIASAQGTETTPEQIACLDQAAAAWQTGATYSHQRDLMAGLGRSFVFSVSPDLNKGASSATLNATFSSAHFFTNQASTLTVKEVGLSESGSKHLRPTHVGSARNDSALDRVLKATTACMHQPVNQAP